MKRIPIFYLIVFFVFTSCLQNDLFDPNRTWKDPFTGLEIPQSFDWSTSSQITINITTNQDSQFVFVYDKAPDLGGALLTSGVVRRDIPFKSAIKKAKSSNQIYIIQMTTNGIVKQHIVPVSEIITINFEPLTNSLKNKTKAMRASIVLPSIDVTIRQNGTYALQDGKSYLIPADVKLTSFAISGTRYTAPARLYIQGNATIPSALVLSNIELYIMDGGSLTATELSSDWNKANLLYLDPKGSLSINGNMQLSKGTCEFVNYGSVHINGSLNVNNQVKTTQQGLIFAENILIESVPFVNNGVLNISNDIVIRNTGASFSNNSEVTANNLLSLGGEVNNAGTIVCSSNMQISNQGGMLNNNCKIIINDKLTLTGVPMNIVDGAYVKCNSLSSYNYGSTINIDNDALLETSDVSLNGTSVNGSSTKFGGVWIIKNRIDLNNTISISDYIEIVAEKDLAYSKLKAYQKDKVKVRQMLSTIINPSSCNSGAVPVRDYFPAMNKFATLIFEDLWPFQGDYDMNDLVVGYQIAYNKTLESDLVSSMEIFCYLRAFGSNMEAHSLGIQLDAITPSEVKKVTGSHLSMPNVFVVDELTGLEKGLSIPVIPVFDNCMDLITWQKKDWTFNTIPDGGKGTSDTLKLVVEFAQPVPKQKLIDLNFFMLQNMERSHEVHLKGFKPTAKANAALFGQGQDNTIPFAKRYYQTISNHVWGVIILEEFNYPIEKVSLLDAYPKFKDWANSAGSVDSDWYQFPADGKVYIYK